MLAVRSFSTKNRGPGATEVRKRVRLGLHWQGENNTAVFYGMTWLGEEFDGQAGGQVIGSARLNLWF
jgi:hypothetical protein